jgi:hypothetical protein
VSESWGAGQESCLAPHFRLHLTMNRREFIVGSTAALVVATAGTSYVFSSCPLDTDGTGVCTGPCAALIDFDGDGFCDRLPPPLQVSEAGAISQAMPALERACPFGLINDPYPGQCNLYVDSRGDGICDLSQPMEDGSALGSGSTGEGVPGIDGTQPAAPSVGAVLTACPLGLVNDPYPGECRRYVDNDGNGICDLSEPALIASGEVVPPPTPTPGPAAPADAKPADRPLTACPYGLINDPYPGECRRYVDNDGNGICDLSEPELVASGAVAPSAGAVAEHSGGQGHNGGGQQRRRGQNGGQE